MRLTPELSLNAQNMCHASPDGGIVDPRQWCKAANCIKPVTGFLTEFRHVATQHPAHCFGIGAFERPVSKSVPAVYEIISLSSINSLG